VRLDHIVPMNNFIDRTKLPDPSFDLSEKPFDVPIRLRVLNRSQDMPDVVKNKEFSEFMVRSPEPVRLPKKVPDISDGSSLNLLTSPSGLRAGLNRSSNGLCRKKDSKRLSLLSRVKCFGLSGISGFTMNYSLMSSPEPNRSNPPNCLKRFRRWVSTNLLNCCRKLRWLLSGIVIRIFSGLG